MVRFPRNFGCISFKKVLAWEGKFFGQSRCDQLHTIINPSRRFSLKIKYFLSLMN